MKFNLRLCAIAMAAIAATNAFGAKKATINGRVTCNDKPLSGVVVSDGVITTTTDNKGYYALPSQKKYGSVFVSTPKGYCFENIGNRPAFYSDLKKNAKTPETVNFELKADNSADNGYIVLGLADIHLSNKCDDFYQYDNIYMPDINNLIADYQKQGKKVYAINLGDQAWDKYWYSNDCRIPRVSSYLDKLKADGMYTIMGNHDNNGYVPDDFDASAEYRKYWGPTHYSFNIGDIHYVCLDNIHYLNRGGKEGQLGDRKYTIEITPDQMEWLRSDLSHIADKSTPLVVCFHAPLFERPKFIDGKASEPALRSSFTNAQELVDALSDFKNVRVLSGHAHVNDNETMGNITENNIAAVCGTWWYTGRHDFFGAHIAKDGSVGGYRVLEVNGRDIDSHFKSIGFDRNYQFRAYDLNHADITAAKYCPDAPHADQLASFMKRFKLPELKNGILANVWGYDKNWKVEMFEDGKPLEVSRVRTYDPLFIVTGACAYLYSGGQIYDENGKTLRDTFNPVQNSHFFIAQASKPYTTVTIKVTDERGRVFTQEMKRPKSLSFDMK